MSSCTFIIPGIETTGLDRKFEPPAVEIVGCYSNDSERNYIDGAENLKYVKLFEEAKRVRYDLNKKIDWKAFEKFDKEFIPMRKEQNSRLVHFLKWINLHQEDFEGSRPNFVMLRGMMEKIFTSPYHCKFNEDWRVGAIKKNGTIYLRKILTKEQLEPKSNRFMIRASAWGHNFENFILSDEPNEEPDPNKVEAPGAECHVVLKTEVEGHSVLYSAELDGVCAKEGFDLMDMNPKENVDMLKNCHLVEVKTCAKSMQNKLAHNGFRRNKSRQWWVQAVLGGISNMIIGYRDNDTGVVSKLENIPLVELYEKYGSGWYGESGYKFLGDFLSEVKERVVEDETVYIFSFKKEDQVGNDFEVLFEQPEEGSEYLLTDLI